MVTGILQKTGAGGTAILAGMLCLCAEADMIDTSGMQPWEVCGLCHGLDGVSPVEKFPVLAGQRAGYIEKQFLDFNRGTRDNDGGQMETITTEIDPQDLPAIADYFASQPLPEISGETDEALFKKGKSLFETGRKNLRPCAECHAANSPEEINAPNLFGQHRAYLKKQLRDFQNEDRRNDMTGTMKEQAMALRADEIGALTYFLNRNRPIEKP